MEQAVALRLMEIVGDLDGILQLVRDERKMRYDTRKARVKVRAPDIDPFQSTPLWLVASCKVFRKKRIQHKQKRDVCKARCTLIAKSTTGDD